MSRTIDKLYAEYGAAAIARHCGVTRQRAWNWKSRGIPPKYVVKVEELTGGKYTRYQLSSEVFGRKP